MLKPFVGEPLVGFALAGCLVFLLFHWLSDSGREQITVTQVMIDDMLSYRAEILDRPLSGEEKQSIIAEFVNREILLREAVARGIHKEDGRIRKRLIEKMNFLLEEEPAEPTAQQLDALYQSDPKKFYTQRLTSFEQVYFKSDRQRAVKTLEGIKRGNIDPETAGEKFWLGRHMESYATQALLTLFGFDFVNRLHNAPLDEWHGVIQSGRGQHLVRVLERREPEPLPEPQLQQRLRDEWIRLQRLESRARRLEAVRGNYEVILPENRGAE